MGNSAQSTPKANGDSRVSPFLEKIVDLGSQAASSVGSMVDNAACAVGKTADNLAAGAGSSIVNLGDKLACKAPQAGLIGQASKSVANTLKAGGHYLQDAKARGALDDLSGAIKRNPIKALLISFGAGLLLSRATRR